MRQERSADQTVRVWSAQSGELLQTLHGHQGEVTGVKIHLGHIFSSSSDHSVRRWDIRTGRCIKKYLGHTATVWCLHLAGQHLFTGSDDLTARQFDIATGESVREFKGHSGSVLSLCTACMDMDGFFREGLLCTGSEDGSIRLWRIGPVDMEGGVCVAVSAGQAAKEAANMVAKNAARRATASGERSYGQQPVQNVSHKWEWQGSIHCVCANDQGILYTGSASGVISEFDLNDKAWVELPPDHPGQGGPLWLQQTNSWAGNQGGVMDLACGKEGYLFTASEDCTVHEFWVKKRTKINSVAASKQDRAAVRFESSGVGSYQPTQRIPHLRSRQRVNKPQPSTSSEVPLKTAEFRQPSENAKLAAQERLQKMAVEQLRNKEHADALTSALEKEVKTHQAGAGAGQKEPSQESYGDRSSPVVRLRERGSAQRKQFAEVREKHRQMEEYNRTLEKRLRELEIGR